MSGATMSATIKRNKIVFVSVTLLILLGLWATLLLIPSAQTPSDNFSQSVPPTQPSSAPPGQSPSAEEFAVIDTKFGRIVIKSY